jgi:hypothetical protein
MSRAMADREERHTRLARHRPGEQGLARARWPDQEHALGDPRAQFAIALGVFEKFHDLLQFRLGLINARNIFERHPVSFSTYTLALLLPTV